LVTAASSDEQSDTHWLRSSVDSHFADQVRQAGITLWEETRFERLSHAQPWQVDLSSAQGITRQVKAKFLIDASGRSAVLASPLRRAAGSSLPASASDALLTHSRAVFGHFRGVQPWHEMLVRAQVATTAHPFSCDRAAVHHLIQHGWMWQLNFDNGVTSLGFAIEPDFYAALEGKPAAEQFRHLLQSYPMLQEQLANAECVAPAGGLQASGRLQYLNLPAAGQGWACLPAAVGFVDPLHSTGIAHTLYSVRALARIFASGDLDPVCMAAPLQSYSQRLEQELRLIDRMVYLCYATLQDFDCFAASCMLYFAASTYAEASLRSAGELEGNDGSFLNASSPAFWQVLHKALKLLAQCQAGSTPWHEYPTAMARLIRPFNLVGLCDPTLNHMYSATSASVES
jgi:FADH2 O2-dependent halogenase